MNQTEMILEMLVDGWVSPLDALKEAGCLRLGARIYDIKKAGWSVQERRRTYTSRFGEKTIKEFRLAR